MASLDYYKKPILLDRNNHRNLRLTPPAERFKFAVESVAVPVTPLEFAGVCHEYPIVFAVDEERAGMPMVLTGLREGENLFVNDKGVWLADYVPAFVRRYPFVLNVNEQEQSFLVIIDEAFEGFSNTEGEPLFDEEGKEAPFLQQTLTFLRDFHEATRMSDDFMKRLKQLDLLIPHTVEIRDADGVRGTLTGFSIVDEKRLLALDDKTMLELARSGDLGRIYAHLLSLGNVQRLIARLEVRLGNVPA